MEKKDDQTFGWNSNYELDVKEIDEQHRQLIELAERVLTISSPLDNLTVVVESIQELQSHIETHFADEEELMSKFGYPSLEQHRLLHREIALKVETMQQAAQDANTLVRKMKEILRRWVVWHIPNEDRKLADYLRSLR